MINIAVIGVGQIGEALVSGLISAGREPSHIVVTDFSAERAEEIAQRYGVRVASDNSEAVEEASVVFICVKPPAVVPLLGEVSDALENSDDLVLVSLAAGITVSALEEATPAGQPVIRVMPNTPMLVGQGMSAVSPGRYASDEQVATVVELLGAVGQVVTVAESDMDAVTALSGSGPAYFFLFTEALIDAGVELGLTRNVASQLAKATAAGAGALLAEEGADPVTLRAGVSSPGGTTVAAIRELEESGLRGAVYRAAEKCAQRSQALGN